MCLRVLSLLFFLLSYSGPQAVGQPRTGGAGVFYGTVYDAETDQPLVGANVFLAGSTRGTATNAEGHFSLDGIPLGSHELVVSFVGYTSASERIRLTQTEARSFTFRLAPVVLPEQEIEVTALSEKTWQRQFEKFEKFFLGVSRYANKCTILNPEVLHFEETEDRFVVTAREPLMIENQALGYMLRFVLDDFELREGQQFIKYGGRVGFTELTPASQREQKRWTKRRLEAYHGSMRHFLASLVRDRLWDEGFMLLSEEELQQQNYSGVPGSRPAARVTGVSPEEIMTLGELPHERTLSFVGYLKVIYYRELPTAQYLKFRQYSGRSLPTSEDEQVSYIALNQPSVNITTDGHVVDTFGLTKFGYWYFERVADLLPDEYTPDGLPPLPGHTAAQAGIDLRAGLQEGSDAVAAGQFEAAVAALAPVVSQDPGYAEAELGTAAYWLGQAYAGLGRHTAAHQAWREGLQALADTNHVSARLADTYIRSVYRAQDQDAYEAAAWAYLLLLERAHLPLPDDDAARIRRHVSQMLPLLTDEERMPLLDGRPGPLYQRLRLQPDAGMALAQWWRAQDPLPGSTLNERVAEHLARVAYAENHFAFEGSPEGYDARGRAYVRYGPPYSNTPILVDISHATQVLRENGYPMPGSIIPPMNEFWTYRHVDELIYYLFVLRGGRYQEGTAEDLVPGDLKSAHKRIGIGHNNPVTVGNADGNASPANQVFAEALFELWKSVYAQLVVYHPAFEKQVEDLEMIESDIRATSFGDSRTIAASALSFVTGTEAQFDALAREGIQRRKNEAPPSHSRVSTAFEPLPVAFRQARFLAEDGSTTTELYWSHAPGTLTLDDDMRRDHLRKEAPDPEDYYMEMVVTIFGEDYRQRIPSGLRYVAADLPAGTTPAIQTVEVTGHTTPYHLAIQWDQFLAHGEGTEAERGAYLRTGIEQQTALRPLNPDPEVLEMSDLKPVLVRDPGSTTHEPYPFAMLRTEQAVGLAFEVYHLAFGDDDRTHYTIEYEVVRDPGRRGEERTSAQTAYTTLSSSTEEFIGVDLSPFAGSGPLEITVRVLDSTTGQSVSRTLAFTLDS